MGDWARGRGLLGRFKPLMGEWHTQAEASAEHISKTPYCSRSFREFGKNWVELEARWEMGSRGTYRELAMFGAAPDGQLAVYSFTNDGKRSEGRLVDGTDIHPVAIAFQSNMPAGVARMIYWPADNGSGFQFAVESQTKKGWNRFLHQTYVAK